jgi:hypothetical protein
MDFNIAVSILDSNRNVNIMLVNILLYRLFISSLINNTFLSQANGNSHPPKTGRKTPLKDPKSPRKQTEKNKKNQKNEKAKSAARNTEKPNRKDNYKGSLLVTGIP